MQTHIGTDKTLVMPEEKLEFESYVHIQRFKSIDN